jgi:hypothetical protein
MNSFHLSSNRTYSIYFLLLEVVRRSIVEDTSYSTFSAVIVIPSLYLCIVPLTQYILSYDTYHVGRIFLLKLLPSPKGTLTLVQFKTKSNFSRPPHVT